jgi:hypothetical protein
MGCGEELYVTGAVVAYGEIELNLDPRGMIETELQRKGAKAAKVAKKTWPEIPIVE